MGMTWTDVLIQVVQTITNVVITVGIPYLFSLLSKKIRNDKASEYLTLADQIISDSVKMVSQTFTDSLKAEGKFDANAQAKAFEMCRTNVINMMSDSMKCFIINEVGDIDAWLDTKIESAVVSAKSLTK